MCANFKSDHRQELLQAVRQDVHTIQLMCLDGTITASGLLLATISPLIRVSFLVFFYSLGRNEFQLSVLL